MKVILAEHHGFCYGVKRAVRIAQENSSANNKAAAAYTLGPIIHNPQMVARLADESVGMVESLDEAAPGDTIIIRSHGVGPATYAEAEQKGFVIVDATCPHVKRAQMTAHKLSEDGYDVVIVGEAKHPEVRSIFEWSGKKAAIVETTAEAEQISHHSRIGVVAQTTFSSDDFDKIVAILNTKCDEIKVERTICNATDQRQKAAVELAGKVDMMLVIGGKNSANTTHLADLCRETSCPTYHIETVSELNNEWFKDTNTIGITAGASTPDWIIEEVNNKVQEMESMEMLLEESMKEVRPRAIVKGKVVGIQRNEVFVDLGYKSEGIIPLNQLAYPAPENAEDVVAVGDDIDVYVVSIDGEDGVKLSKTKADSMAAWEKLEKVFEEKTPVQAKVTKAVKGGVTIAVMGARGFVPASQMDVRFIDDLSVFVGKTYDFMPLEFNKEKQRAVFSRRVLLEAEKKRAEAAIFEQLETQKEFKGIVKRLTKFGAFVDIGGVDGLVHISELSWERVNDPAEVVAVGDEVTVIVKSFDPVTKRIALSMKDAVSDPWLDKVELLSEGKIVAGKVEKVLDFGAFIDLGNELNGLVHISEISNNRVNKVSDVLTAGDSVNVKVIRIDKENKKIGLSIKQIEDDKETAEYKEFMAAQDEVKTTVGEQLGDALAGKED